MITLVTATAAGRTNAANTSGSLALIAILTLLALLIQKELAAASNKPWARQYARLLNVPIVPLLLVFAVVVGAKIAEALQ
jgi:hypothetical protein